MSYTRLLFLFFVYATPTSSQDIMHFSIIFDHDVIDVPIQLPMQNIGYLDDSLALSLYEIKKNEVRKMPIQLESGHRDKLWFLYPGQIRAGSIKKFKLTTNKGNSNGSQSNIDLTKNGKELTLIKGSKPILSYRYTTQFPPDGVNPLYKRSGFIHPLWSPGGKVLTRIQPPDHYHHYGIWGPWTKTKIGDREIDFWNLKKGQGTVKFAGFLSQIEGDVYSGFSALQQHIDFGGKGPDQIAMNEALDIRVWNTENNKWIIDYTTTLNSPLENGILLDAYRYGGGIGFRATEEWKNDNCTVLTSEGKTRLDADGSNARWCIVEGINNDQGQRSGILFLSHPSNRKHPEPMRVWPIDANNGRGDMYFEFVPIRHEAWKINPNQNHTLKYRMIIFDGKMDTQTAELYWNSFAKIPEIKK